MPYGDAGYISHHRDNERVASMIRSITQDGCRDMQNATLDPIFESKMVDGVDIGKVCSNLIMKIAGSLQDSELVMKITGSSYDDIERNLSNYDRYEKKTIMDLISIIFIDYIEGVNPNKDIVWQITWLTKGIPLFMKKINTLPGTGKVAPMASLEKPDKNKEEIHEWWKQ